MKLDRRNFIKTSGVAAAATVLPTNLPAVNGGGSDAIKVGLIGCGPRGIRAAMQCVQAAPGVTLYAMGDVFPDKLERARSWLADGYTHPSGRWGVDPLGDDMQASIDRRFTGLDAYQKVIESGVDLVLLATPPYFRPLHLRAAIEAGKHVFVEKPAAVDVLGARSIIASGKLANEKNLTVVAGTQRRHTPRYLETIARIRDGAIGEVVAGQCYWISGQRRELEGQPAAMSEMEYQIRNWYHHLWLSGDHICEQHIHNLDVMNWMMDAVPKSAIGMGGRQTPVEAGNNYDHFSTEFEFEQGVRVSSYCSQIPGSSQRVGERIIGTLGSAVPGEIKGKHPWKYEGPSINGQEQEHKDLIASIRGEGPYLNHAKRVAESTLTAILGRTSAYSGRTMSFGWLMNRSEQVLGPDEVKFGDYSIDPIAIPGQYTIG